MNAALTERPRDEKGRLLPVTVAVTSTDAEVEEYAVFYAPDEPEIKVVIPNEDPDPNRHSFWSAWKSVATFDPYGVLRTNDPDVKAAIRRGVAKGRYFEADLPEASAPRCPECGVTIRNQKAYARHVRRHFATD